jgi:hypothetical protein
MIYFAASVGLQILCVIHVMRTGRNQMWMWIIIFFSLLGCLAYFIVEVLPAHGGNRYVRHARAQVGAKLNPEKALREAQDALSLADTAANRIAVADALTGLGRHREAAPYYRQALDMTRGGDHGTLFKLAQAHFEIGQPAETLRLLAELPEASGSIADQRNLLLARALAETGEDARARPIFEDVISRLAGDEARCHYAHFLIDRGDRNRARQILEEVDQRAKRLHPLQRAEAADMYRWASTQLGELRGG